MTAVPTTETETAGRTSTGEHPLLFDTASNIGRLRIACYERMTAHERVGSLPTSATFVFYELEGMGAVTKSPINSRTGKPRKRTDRQYVSDALMDLRLAKLIPWEWIADETRAVSMWEFTDDIDEIVDAAMTAGRLDLWDGDPPPLIVCESRSLKGVLEDTAALYLTPIGATNGQAGGFLYTDMLPLLEGAERRVLYLGDLDHQGGQIETNTRSVLVRELGREIDWRRLAITEEQVTARDLTPISKPDRRYKPARYADAWETEALGQQTVVSLLRDALDELLPEPLAAVLVREREAKAQWREEHGR
jgi:hypothetical protein